MAARLTMVRLSLAERIIPAADLSEKISFAGTEASGAGNMKLQLNGALTIGALDGAGIEIREEVGEENIFIFGLTADQVEQRRPNYHPWDVYNSDEEIRRALKLVEADSFSMLEPGFFRTILNALLDRGDRYMLLADLRDYIETQTRVDALYPTNHVMRPREDMPPRPLASAVNALMLLSPEKRKSRQTFPAQHPSTFPADAAIKRMNRYSATLTFHRQRHRGFLVGVESVSETLWQFGSHLFTALCSGHKYP
jgi:glucan phosphorylase